MGLQYVTYGLLISEKYLCLSNIASEYPKRSEFREPTMPFLHCLPVTSRYAVIRRESLRYLFTSYDRIVENNLIMEGQIVAIHSPVINQPAVSA